MNLFLKHKKKKEISIKVGEKSSSICMTLFETFPDEMLDSLNVKELKGLRAERLLDTQPRTSSRSQHSLQFSLHSATCDEPNSKIPLC